MNEPKIRTTLSLALLLALVASGAYAQGQDPEDAAPAREVVVLIRADGVAVLGDRPVTWDALEAHLGADADAPRPKDGAVRLRVRARVHPETAYLHVDRLQRICAGLGITRLTLSADPSVPKTGPRPAAEVLVIRLRRSEGTVRVRVGDRLLPSADGSPDAKTLVTWLRANKDAKVSIDAAEDVSYRHVVQVLNACVEAGIEDITFAVPGSDERS